MIETVRLALPLFAAVLGVARTGTAQTTYDFEALAPGALFGQDGWVSATFGTPALAVTTGVGTNDTRVVENSQSAVTVMGRRSDATFGLPPLSGTETSVTLELDCIADWEINFNAFVGLAPWADLNSNSVVDAGEVGPLFGFNHNGGSGAPSFYLGDSAAGATSILAPVPTSVDPGDWLRIRLTMDLTANAGNGAGTLSYRNLTDEDAGYSPTGVTSFNLRFAQGRHPTTWNGVFIRIDDGAPGTSVRLQLDDLKAVPEPSIGIALAVASLALGFWTARRRRASGRPIPSRPMGMILSLPLLTILTIPALAADGVLEINQTCALQGGCIAGDDPDFPVTIATSGSYRLTSNLTVPDENTTAISISASGATLDLGGFEIRGPNSCTGSPIFCTLSGEGFGVELTGSRVHLLNGAITGMGAVGVYGPANLVNGAGHVVEDVRVSSNRYEGIRLDGDGVHVRGVTSVANGTVGVLLSGTGSVLAESVSSKNGIDGVLLGSLCTSQENQIVGNGRYGLFSSGSPNFYRDNTIASNASGSVIGGAVNVGDNVCSPLACP